MSKKVLLTYIKDGKRGFDWFENVHDMEISIIERGIKKEEICDIIYIHDYKNVELSFECESCMEKSRK